MSGWRWFTNGGLDGSPFTRAHCVPLAFANVMAKPSRKSAVIIADTAYLRIARNGHALLSRRGRAQGRTHDDFARIAGLKVVEQFQPVIEYVENSYYAFGSLRLTRVQRVGAPTLAQFARGKGRRGRWVVYTNGHAQAVVNGKLRGFASPRCRVRYAVRLEEA